MEVDSGAGPEASNRVRVFDFIKSHPGTHFREIKRELGLAMGVIQYHLYALEKEGAIISKRRGLYKRFYPTFTFGERAQEILGVLSQETERDLLLHLIENPYSSQSDLSEYAMISPATVNWHMRRLMRSGLVEAKREGQYVRYKAAGDVAEVLRLLKSYHPTIWERWADRLADTFVGLPEGGINGRQKEVEPKG